MSGRMGAPLATARSTRLARLLFFGLLLLGFAAGCGDTQAGAGSTHKNGPSDAGLDGTGATDATHATDASASRLSVCVLQDRGPTGRCADPSIIDFGTVPAGGSATRLFRIDNVGSTPVQFTDLNVAAGQFQLTAVLYQASTGDPNSLERVEQTLPVERQPDESLYVEVTFNAGDTSGQIPADHVTVQAAIDGASQRLEVPMSGEVLACEAGHGDCDGDASNGCEANLNADDLNCGACGQACDTDRGTGTCVNGTCMIDQCTAPYADCDNIDENGCEVDTDTDIDHCGGCNTMCTPPHATATCDQGVCGIDTCDPGFADCNNDPADGCEVNLANDPVHCGSCDTACSSTGATAVCVDSTCTMGGCHMGYENCDNNLDNGCEINTQSDTQNCGACNNECTNDHGSTVCNKATCVPTCQGLWDDCDSNPDNGCEQSLSQLDSCGACGQLCDLPNAVESCSTGTCELVRCETGFADCDGDPTNGCEVNLNNDVDHCGTCANACSNAHGSTVCSQGTCAPTCQGLWGDCDSTLSNGCEQDLTSLSSCGQCGVQCDLANAQESCGSGSCTLGACDAGFSNCDSDPTNGCEVDTNTDPDHCGGCGIQCTNNHGSRSCDQGTCSPSCDLGYASCNGDPTDGCETPLNTLTDCGACGQQCSLPHAQESCGSMTCQLVRCDPGYADCDGDPTNGCEVDLNSNTANCGQCGNTCTNAHGSAVCSGGTCAPSCNSGYDDCNNNPDDGCETSLSSLTNCGACGSVCALNNASEVCVSGSCQIGSCNAGYANCNGSTLDGCETGIVSNRDNCGACGNTCTNSHGSTQCTAGTCQPTCNAGYDDCDSNADNGCETNIAGDANNCGACGNQCNLANATAMCTNGGCAVAACDAGWVDCDGDPTNGCEVNVMNDEGNCGACGNTCTNAHGSTYCNAGSCSPTCNANYDDCDNNADNGCETSLLTLSDCGSCGQACNLAHASQSCGTGSCQISSCYNGYCDLNNSDSDGCEHNLNTNPACSGATSLNSVDGDGNSSTSATGKNEQWFKIVVKDTFNVATNEQVRIDLTSPAGANYDLYTRCGSCSSTTYVGGAGAGGTETISYQWNDGYFSTDNRTIYIGVIVNSVNTCADKWTLTVRGNTTGGSVHGC